MLRSVIAHHLAHRAVVGHRVVVRADRPEPVAALGVGAEAPARLHRRLGRELHVVLAVAVARPDVEQGAGQRLAVAVGDPAHVERRLARNAFADVAAERQVGRARPVERTLDRRLGRRRRAAALAAGTRLRQRDDHHRQAERVGEEDELGALVGRDLAGAGQELQAGEPFLGLQIDLAGEGVHMLDQRRHDLAQPRIGRLGERVDDVLRQPLLVVLGHLRLLDRWPGGFRVRSGAKLRVARRARGSDVFASI